MHKKLWALLPLSFLLMSNAPVLNAAKAFDGRFYDSSLKMDFTDTSKENIDKYYSAVDNTSIGSSFINELYSVISKDNHFVKYDDVNKWYKITDRNWKLSQPIDPDTFKFSNDTANNYYFTLLYFKDNETKSKQINNLVNGKSWTIDKNLDHIDFDNKIKPNKNIQEDKEHIWAKSHGFSPSGDPEVGAGTDLHHLLAADHHTNNIHNNNYYGYIDRDKPYSEVYCYYADGTTDLSGWSGKDKDGDDTFEPTDQYKGDIARALLYMGVRYSNKQETNTRSEPYLLLTDDKTQKDDNDHFHGVHQHLSDFLKWNELDPVSDYEIHRNNLIYNNVQNNRNPFIDHPEWARRAYAPDTYKTTSDFSSLKDSYNLHTSDTLKLPVTYSPKSTINVSFDSNYLSMSDDKKTFKALKECKEGTTIKIDETTENGIINHFKTKMIIWNNPILKTDLPKSIQLAPVIGNSTSYKLDIKVDNLFPEEKIVLKSGDDTIARISNDNTIEAVGFGTTTISVLVDKSSKKLGEFKIEVTPSVYFNSENIGITIGIIIAIVIILVLIIVLSIVFAKKGKKKSSKKPSSKSNKTKKKNNSKKKK